MNEPTVTSVNVNTGSGSQLSVAVAVPVNTGSTPAEHSTNRSAGHMITGGVESSTVTVCKHVLVLPQSSVAVHVLKIVYSCSHTPEATVASLNDTIGTRSQLSVAVAKPVASGNVLSVHSTVMSSGHVKTGAVLSSTVMICTHAGLTLPHASVDIHVLEVVYSCTHNPEATVHP